MSNTCEKMTVSMERELKVCTNLFLKEPVYGYEIVQMEKMGVYGIIDKKEGELIITFKKMEEFHGERYLLTLEDNSKVIIKIYGELRISEPFWKVIKLLSVSGNLYALVCNKDLERYLIKCNAINFDLTSFPSNDSFVIGEEIGKNATVILTKDLKTYDIIQSETSISSLVRYSMCAIITDNLTHKKRLLRFSDMRISRCFTQINPLSNCDIEYALVKLNNKKNKEMILRIKDFVCSSALDGDSIYKLSDNYIAAKKDGKDVVVRLPDFSIAEFD